MNNKNILFKVIAVVFAFAVGAFSSFVGKPDSSSNGLFYAQKASAADFCCRVTAANKCSSGFNSYDMEVARFNTVDQCNAYQQNPPTFQYTCNCGTPTAPNNCESGDFGRDPNQTCPDGVSPKAICKTSGSENFRVEIGDLSLCISSTPTPTVTPTPTPTVPTATPTPTPTIPTATPTPTRPTATPTPTRPTATPTPTPPLIPATCNSLSIDPNPVVLGQHTTFTCFASSGTGINQIDGYAFSVRGVRYPSFGWSSSNVLTLTPTGGGAVWCKAHTIGGATVGGPRTNCSASLSVVTPTPTPTGPISTPTPTPTGPVSTPTPTPTATPTPPQTGGLLVCTNGSGTQYLVQGGGGVATFSIQVTNNSSVNVNGIEINDVLPGGFSYRSGSTSGNTNQDPIISGQTLTWKTFSLTPGNSWSVSFSANAPSGAGTYSNQLSANFSGGSAGSVTCGMVVIQGQILGVTTIPKTGAETGMLFGLVSLLPFGYWFKRRAVR